MTLCIYLVVCHYYGHVTAIRILILMNCYGITNLLLRKFTFTENQIFLRNFLCYKNLEPYSTIFIDVGIYVITFSVGYLSVWVLIRSMEWNSEMEHCKANKPKILN